MAGEIIEQRTNHEALAVSRYIEQFKGKPKLEALIRSYAEQIQDLEDAAFEVILERLLDNAVGVQLQTIAKIVGAPVTTSNDAELRIIIRTQIAINLSDGTAEDLINVLRLILLTSGEAFHIREEPPHQVRLVIDDPLSTIVNPTTAVGLLDSADMASIRVLLDYIASPMAESLAYADETDGASDGLGWGDSIGGGVGGKWGSTTEG